MLKYDVCIYWAPTGVDNQGRPTYTGTSPIEIQCRWEDTNEQMIDKTGRQRTSRSIVYVDRDIDVNGALTHSSLEAIQFVTDPFKNPQTWEVQRFDKVPTLRNRESLRKAYL
jgi:hypothetical protein